MNPIIQKNILTIKVQDFVMQKEGRLKGGVFHWFYNFCSWLPCSLNWHIREALNIALSIALSPLLQKRVNLVVMAAKELQNELYCLNRFYCLYNIFALFKKCCQNIPCKEMFLILALNNDSYQVIHIKWDQH